MKDSFLFGVYLTVGLVVGFLVHMYLPDKPQIQGLGYEVIMRYDGELEAYFKGKLMDDTDIKNFQFSFGLTIDGLVGYKTTTKMNELNRLSVEGK